jgi:hypothetical protein
VYAFTIHCSPVVDAPRSVPIEGSATLTIATSTSTMNWARQQSTRIAVRRMTPAMLDAVEPLHIGRSERLAAHSSYADGDSP